MHRLRHWSHALHSWHQKLTLPEETANRSKLGFGPRVDGAKGFNVDVVHEIHILDMDKAATEKLVHKAHEVCPPSNATRGNIDITLTVA